MTLDEYICDNCRNKFKTTFDRVDHTGFFTAMRTEKGQNLRIFNFCTYSCELEFINKMRKIDPKMVETWEEASEEEKQRYPEYYK